MSAISTLRVNTAAASFVLELLNVLPNLTVSGRLVKERPVCSNRINAAKTRPSSPGSEPLINSPRTLYVVMCVSPHKSVCRGEMMHMARFNPDFWEIPVNFDKLTEFDTRCALWYETDEEREFRWRREDRQEQLMPELMEIIENELTSKQRQAVMLYFFGQKTQEEIGQIMEIPHQVVSQHIHGIRRNGKKIGGAIARIRKACKERGIYLKESRSTGSESQNLSERAVLVL